MKQKVTITINMATLTLGPEQVPLTIGIYKQLPDYPYGAMFTNDQVSAFATTHIGKDGDMVLLNTPIGVCKMSRPTFVNTGMGANIGVPPEQLHLLPRIIITAP